MKSLTLLAFALFFVFTFGVYFYNSSTHSNFAFSPPYGFTAGDGVSSFNGFFFTFIASLLLFGLGAVVAMAIEGLKFGSMLSAILISSQGHLYDVLFAVPVLVACMAATTLAAGLVLDYRGKASVFPYWNYAIKYFAVGLALNIALILVRSVVVTS